MIMMVFAAIIIGSGWILLPNQVASVGPEFAAAYRLLIGGITLAIFNSCRRIPLPKPTTRFCGLLLVYGTFMYSINYLLCYEAAQYIASGHIALVVSAMVIPNMIYGRIFLGKKMTAKNIMGVGMSLCGLGLIFLDFSSLTFELTTQVTGLLLCLVSIFFSGFGTIVGIKLNQAHHYHIAWITALGLIIGGALSNGYAFYIHGGFKFSTGWPFLRDLLYLSVISVPLGFMVYAKVAAKQGPDKAAYIWILAPIISLGLSTYYEGLPWDSFKVSGVVLTLLGSSISLLKNIHVRGLKLKKTLVTKQPA